MFKMSGIAVAAMLVAGASGTSLAQPPGPGGFEKKDPRREAGDRKDGPQKEGDRQPGDPVQALERQLAELRARTAEVEAQLKKVRAETGGDRPGQPMPRGPGGPTEPGRPVFGPGGPGGFGPGGPGGGGIRMGGGPENLSAEQIKEMIGRLQKILESKAAGDQPRKPTGDQPKKPGNPDRGGASQEEILKRLDKLTQELDEIRRSIKK